MPRVRKTNGREFEMLVARMQRVLTDRDAKIRLRERIPYLYEGMKGRREVDVSIRFTEASVPFLVTVECRDRASVSDVIWIEQIANKKRLIGANHTIAVSSSHFSSEAIALAKHEGIQVRTIGEIDDRDIQGWAGGLRVQQEIGTWKLLHINVEVQPNSSEEQLITPDEVNQEVVNRGILAEFLINKSDHKKWSINDVLSQHVPYETVTVSADELGTLPVPHVGKVLMNNMPVGALVLLDGVPPTGELVSKEFQVKFEPGIFEVETTLGNRPLLSVRFLAELTLTRAQIPRTRLVTLNDISNSTTYAFEETDVFSSTDPKVKMTLTKRLTKPSTPST